MASFFVIALSSFVFSFSAQGSCVQDPGDPYEPARLIDRGFYEGECVDTSSVRAVQLISTSVKSYEVANVYYLKTWWTAQISMDSVDRVLFHIVPFESHVPFIQAAHTQLRFMLKKDKPLLLRRQNKLSPEYNKAPLELRDIIISSTFTASVGETYNALKSFGNSYGIVTRLLATEDRAREEITKDKSVVRQFPLRLTSEEGSQLLRQAIERGSADGDTKFYRLLGNNCSTLIFDILDGFKNPPEGVKPVRGSLWNMRDEFIEPSIRALIARRLIRGREDEGISLNEELGLLAQ